MRSAIALAAAAFATIASGASFDCLPGHRCWPTTGQWQKLNSTLNGNLGITQPYAKPCFDNVNSAECAKIQQEYRAPETRPQVYGSRQNINWEVCGSNSCLLNSTEPRNPITSDGKCYLGRNSAYYVKVTCANDVSETLKFVKKHNIRISIKNSGHDYFGRSSAANSLALWTYNLKNIQYHQKFRLTNCTASYENVGVIGAGISAREAFTFFQEKGMHVTVGAFDGVGIAGGFGQAGGHGPFGPSYGLMVDQAIEFDVVTADGKQRTVNECNHPDLFWALRGGGGGTYAVLLNYKFKVYPAQPMNIYSFRATLNTPATDVTTSAFHRDVVAAIASNTSLWADNKIAGYNFFTFSSYQSLRILPSSDTQKFKDVLASWASLLENYPGITIQSAEFKTVPTYTEYIEFIKPFLVNAAVGLGVYESSRLVPRSLFETPDSRSTLVDTFLKGMQTSRLGGAGGVGHIYATGPVNTPDKERKTSVHGAWRDSLWHALYPGAFFATTPPAAQAAIGDAVSRSIQGFKDLTPGGGAYANEGWWGEEDWKATFFGDRYRDLENVKKRWDAEWLFDCYKCVGWRGKDDLFYSCWKSEGQVPTIPLDGSQR